MICLALETATDFCSVALEVDGEISVREALAPRRHAELLIPWIRELLEERDIGFGDLDALAVSRGPGGFTSLRIGLGVAQGIALAHELPIHAVSTLAALARAADSEWHAKHVLAVLDARMSEVYAGFFDSRDGDHVAVADEVVVPPAGLALPHEGPWLAAGSGLASYGDELESVLAGKVSEKHPDIWPDARSVLALAETVEPVHAWELEPKYVRDDVAN
ncbi:MULTISPECIES: tRNA (adenosine(37)-N6)-threonylcarbamoyltransferase complex dimerization subunit type 1 TsaB [unclassified Wenzhouxiangella]|uniref:tRNA (adenosine(37)-N6)-threonylcarbamoyltransferase complex dimerization subunit type 1 TsaB n=1 Tax=unclassified Wenzhouxiangella TaxID=2613841 RepID=UPI000E3273CC|nr:MULTISPECIES: tRNA (adenosine(37)-N6)-threonylcarbamoyltransferase complex dimerization subunit type 1 TsaB [unclassified Wenzhouxiangella]RFF28161.1 tRNA (adenosine(37)-N6)-threonylcarbamoyltransferase complex dimerization subunit type 1 TsaB [Wenzhouxiangella sp. 15181]RFP67972.1 tRNA (adenosine(37)-N6)-threonylcarbamoyltransferase complex dimerization subunit type 1 TsaB [Wenzhouxiangella sp. 15190]